MLSRSSFFKESVVYGLTGALSKFSIFLTIPIYTRYLTVDDFGTLDLYLTISMFIYILLEMQMQSGFMRSYYEKQKENKLDEFVGTTVVYYLLGYGFIMSILLFIYLLKIESQYLIINYLLPIILFILPKQIFDLNNILMRMEHKPKQYMIYNISYISLISVLGILSVVFIEPKIEYILWSTFIGTLIFGIISFKNIVYELGIKYKINHFKEIFYYGAPIVPAIIGSWAMSGVGRIYISEYLTLTDLGVYSLALKIGMIFLLFVQAFRTAWDPFVIKKFGEKSSESKKIFAKALNYYIALGFVFIFIIYLLTPVFINILATDEYITAAPIVPILLLSYFWQGAVNIIAVGNSWLRKTYLNAFGSLIGSAVVIISTYFLIKLYGLYGVAIGQLIGFMIHFFMTMYFAQKNIYIDYNKVFIIFIIILTIVLVIYQMN